ncbi:MAG: GAF domain-containing protein [Lachnospiraceae bacterium]|nr:GAF domain-containing protein [Lachnospiraceae bacterium]
MDIIKKKVYTQKEMYAAMVQHIKDIFRETPDLYAALANTSAMLNLYLDQVNWVGFYIMKDLMEKPKNQDVNSTEDQKGDQNESLIENQNGDQNERLVENQNGYQNEGVIENQNGDQNEKLVENQNGIQIEDKKENRIKRSLVLGPFQGKPAVAHIKVGSGVCGTAVESRCQQRVDDVRSCCNHIACDLATASEIVTPVFVDGEVWGVIDIDSPLPARFDVEDEEGMKALAEELGEQIRERAFSFRINQSTLPD